MKRILIILIMLITTITKVNAIDVDVLPSIKGIVKNIEYTDLENPSVAEVKQVVTVKLINKELNNGVVYIDNILTGNPYYDMNLKKGMKVIIHVESTENGYLYSIEDIERSNILLYLSLFFCLLLVAVGRKKGFFSLLSILITCIFMFKILSPMILIGINPVISTILVCLLSTAITIYSVGGINRKSSAAIIGCVLSLIFAGILSLITVKLAYLNGFNGENSLFLFAAHPELNFISIIISTMILATLGAVMDVAMSIASTINEIYIVDNTKTVKELFICGMNVGKDIIGTMANTLILVYLGASLPLILLASNIDIQKFINLNQVVTEISSALIGSCAIIICVPITAFIASELIKSMPEQIEFKTKDE